MNKKAFPKSLPTPNRLLVTLGLIFLISLTTVTIYAVQNSSKMTLEIQKQSMKIEELQQNIIKAEEQANKPTPTPEKITVTVYVTPKPTNTVTTTIDQRISTRIAEIDQTISELNKKIDDGKRQIEMYRLTLSKETNQDTINSLNWEIAFVERRIILTKEKIDSLNLERSLLLK